MEVSLPLPKRPITCLTLSGDQAEAALSYYDSNTIHVLSTSTGRHANDAWKHRAALTRHRDPVTALVWHARTDRLLSCGLDRCAYVWVRPAHTHADPNDERQTRNTPTSVESSGTTPNQSTGGWVPQMVVLSSVLNRGLSSAAWGPSGSKLYIGAASANVAVGCFDAQEQWWVCRVLAHHTSTVTSIAPHPEKEALLATGGLDGDVVLQSCLMKKIDGKKSGAADFGTVYHRVRLGAWVHAVAWSAAGEKFAVATHRGALHIFAWRHGDLLGGGQGGMAEERTAEGAPLPCVTVRFPGLPLRTLSFWRHGESGVDGIVGAGESYCPLVFAAADTTSAQEKRPGPADAAEVATPWRLAAVGKPFAYEDEGKETQKLEARSILSSSVPKLHKATITSVNISMMNGDAFFTAGMDGRVVRWRYDDLLPL